MTLNVDGVIKVARKQDVQTALYWDGYAGWNGMKRLIADFSSDDNQHVEISDEICGIKFVFATVEIGEKAYLVHLPSIDNTYSDEFRAIPRKEFVTQYNPVLHSDSEFVRYTDWLYAKPLTQNLYSVHEDESCESRPIGFWDRSVDIQYLNDYVEIGWADGDENVIETTSTVGPLPSVTTSTTEHVASEEEESVETDNYVIDGEIAFVWNNTLHVQHEMIAKLRRCLNETDAIEPCVLPIFPSPISVHLKKRFRGDLVDSGWSVPTLVYDDDFVIVLDSFGQGSFFSLEEFLSQENMETWQPMPTGDEVDYWVKYPALFLSDIVLGEDGQTIFIPYASEYKPTWDEILDDLDLEYCVWNGENRSEIIDFIREKDLPFHKPLRVPASQHFTLRSWTKSIPFSDSNVGSVLVVFPDKDVILYSQDEIESGKLEDDCDLKVEKARWDFDGLSIQDLADIYVEWRLEGIDKDADAFDYISKKCELLDVPTAIADILRQQARAYCDKAGEPS